MKNLFMPLAAALLAVTAVAPANGDELNPRTQAPQGLIVRQSAAGQVEVFKADAAVSDEATAAKAVESFVKDSNKLVDVKPLSELDRTTSNEAWYHWYNYNYYRPCYSYYSYGYYYNYYPYYNWSYGNYYYWYYRY